MSAVNALIYPDAALLLTDGATNVEGKIDRIGSKVRLFPHLDAAVAITAAMPGVDWIVESYVGLCSISFDDLCDTLPRAVETGLRELAGELSDRGSGEGAFDILAVGLSEREGRFVARVCSYEPGGKPTIKDAGPIYVQPFDPVLEERLEAVGLHPGFILSAPPDTGAEQLQRVMQFQRERAFETGHVVGGFQLATVLTRDNIHSRVVQRWPDRVHPEFMQDA